MAEVASAFVSLVPSAKGFGSSANRQIGPQMNGVAKTTGSRFGKVFAYSSMGPLRALGTAALGFFAVSKIKDFFGSAISEARESQKVSALTAQVIKSTGGAAQISAKQVGNLSTAISNKVGIDDEAIQSGANLLLTFKNIKNEAGAGNDIFNQTTRIMTDMATAMGNEPKAAAIQLGKALNDPIKGISALARVGVTFTDQQKKVIESLVKSGDVAGAQKVILKELNSEFGGAAAAQVTASEKAQVAWGNLKEQIGTALLPTIDKIATVFSTRVVPAISKFIRQMQNGRGAGGEFAAKLKEVADRAKNFGAFLLDNRQTVLKFAAALVAAKVAIIGIKVAMAAYAAVQAVVNGAVAVATGVLAAYNVVLGLSNSYMAVWIGVKAIEFAAWVRSAAAAAIYSIAMGATTVALVASSVATKVAAAGQWLLNAALTANPIGLVVVAIAALVAGLILAYQHSETFRAVVDSVFGFMKTALSATISFIADHWQLIVSIIGGPLVAIGILVVQHWGAIKSFVTSAVSAVINFVRDHWRLIITIIGGPLGLAVALVTKYWGQIKSATSAAWNAVKSVVSAGITAIRGYFNLIGAIVGKVRGWFSDIVSAIKSKLGEAVAFVKTIPGKMLAPLADLGQRFYDAGGKLMSMLGDGIKAKFADAYNALKDAAGKLAGLVPGSPVKEGPLKSFNNGGAGKKLIQMLAEGIVAGTPGAVAAAVGTATAIEKGVLDRLTSMRDAAKSVLDGMKSDFTGLRDTISSAFAGDLFSATSLDDFIGKGFAQSGLLDRLTSAMKKLLKAGVDPSFISDLFSSGNTALILDFAKGSRSDIRTAASISGLVDGQTNALGGAVSMNQYGAEMRSQTKLLRDISEGIKSLPENFGKELDHKGAKAKRGSK